MTRLYVQQENTQRDHVIYYSKSLEANSWYVPFTISAFHTVLFRFVYVDENHDS